MKSAVCVCVLATSKHAHIIKSRREEITNFTFRTVPVSTRMSKFNKPEACACNERTSDECACNMGCACPPTSAGRSADAETLEEIAKFRKFYEDKLRQIDIDGGGDCTELKLKLQERWIRDLTEQTEMMARIVKELEEEATQRVRLLENKLKQTSKAAYEVMKRYQTYSITHNLDEPFQKAFYLESDLKNVLEFIRRVREDGKWTIEGLRFYDVAYEDLFGKTKYDASGACNCINGTDSEKEKATSTENENPPNYEELLKKRNAEYEALRQSMLDMRSALTEEVACKHDMILALKKDVLQLEERCVQADKQTAFKDDIIKELRKEIKQLKQQMKKECDEKKSEEIENLERKLKDAEAKICRMRPCVDTKTACTTMDEALAAKEMEMERELKRRQQEADDLRSKIKELENTLTNSNARSENLQKADSRTSDKSQLRKLRQEKRCYEHALGCFKHEMGVISEQLVNVLELLKLSDESCTKENSQLYNAVADLAQVCDKLKAELKDAEKKVFKENQKNQIKNVQINELQTFISKQNADLQKHDEAINALKNQLENTYLENHQLQTVIAGLNSKIKELKCDLCPKCLGSKSEKNPQPPAVDQKSIDNLQKLLEQKEERLSMMEKEYKSQHGVLKVLQIEFEKIREKNKEKIKLLKRQNEDLKGKLEKAEKDNQQMVEELAQVKEESLKIAKKDSNRDQELVQSRQMILELRQNLVELNENLADSELQQMVLTEEYRKKIKSERQHEDVFFNCRCEIALYRKLVQNLKDMLLKAKTSFTEMEAQNKILHEELKHKEAKLVEMQKRLQKKEKESYQNVKELNEQLRDSQEEEKKLCDCIDQLKNQLQEKENKLMECKCLNNKNEVAALQEEISNLKNEIKRMIQNQLSLNSENDNLLKQVSRLQNSHSILEDKNSHLKQRIEKLQLENQKLKESTKYLQREKDQCTTTIKNLESELNNVRNNWDDICTESKNVINNVKAWLEEQRKIKDKAKRREQRYCETISKLKIENENLQNRTNCTQSSILKSAQKYKQKFRSYSPPPSQTNLDSPDVWCWCYDSQGNDSPRDSPSSFLTCSVDEWYSPNYKDETDFESDQDNNEFINTLEAVTLEMKNNNKKWKGKYRECECVMAPKDHK